MNISMDVKQLEILYTVSGSVSWYNHFGILVLFTNIESMHTL